MLRIKEDFDLEKLKDYGFEKKIYNGEEFYQKDIGDNRTNIIVDCYTNEIGIPTSLYGDIPAQYIDNLDIIYDLIKDGIVEKVSD